ncbi:MAG: aminotransferase class V-fold PLP-dependent enzyme [Desulfobacteraceae bacterium]|nr:aminotransferase class V-fold PLP-dependent enzyme [Desulfobacteraceae bacterium]
MSFVTKANIVVNALNKHDLQAKAGKSKVIVMPPIEELISDFNLDFHIKNGKMSEKDLAQFVEKYLFATTKLHHPSYLAHQVAPPHYAGSLGAMIDGFTNNAMAIYEMGPAAAAIEYFLINWFLEKVGWEPSPVTLEEEKEDARKGHNFGGGILTHGGSIANLTAMIAARNRVAPDAWDNGNPPDLALLAPSGCHYSIARAASIIGVGQKAIYHLQVDKNGAVIPDKLQIVYDQLKNDGKRPIALTANACSTAVGIYDPLDEIGDFCEENNIWFHVDGAHGASALLSQKYKYLLKGIEKADSLTWDAHKLMQVPTLCAALLFRDHNSIDTAFKQEASYLFHKKEQPGFDFIHRTIECTKAGLGLKLFMVLAALGEKGLSEYIEDRVELTLKAYEYIDNLPEFTCSVKPESNILCFRINGKDDLQIKIRDRLIAEGDFYLSTTSFNNVRYLRIVIMSPETTFDEIKKLIKSIKNIQSKLE